MDIIVHPYVSWSSYIEKSGPLVIHESIPCHGNPNTKLVGGIPTPLKNISQWEGLSHILWKIKNV